MTHQYFINGTEVSQRIFDRDCEDNFNAGVTDECTFSIVDGVRQYHLTYDDTYGDA